MDYISLFCSYLFNAHNLTTCVGRESDLKARPVKGQRHLIVLCVVIEASDYSNGHLSLYISDSKLLI